MSDFEPIFRILSCEGETKVVTETGCMWVASDAILVGHVAAPMISKSQDPAVLREGVAGQVAA
jgi:hypothetical protein